MSQTQKETPKMTVNEIKKGQYQWMFVKQNPKARALTTIDMYRRLLMQSQKYREMVKFVLKQLLRQCNFGEQRCARFEQAFQSFRQRETTLKQENHKYKEMICIRDTKIEDLQRQLAERDELVAKYRKIVSPTAALRAPRSPMEPSRVGGKYSGVGRENHPPMSSHRMEGRPSPVGRAYDLYAPPESSHGTFDPAVHQQSLAQHGPPFPPSQPYADGRQRLPTPTHDRNGGAGPYSTGQGHAGSNDLYRRSRNSPTSPYNHPSMGYSRTATDANRETTPISHRYERHHGFYGDGRGDGSMAGSRSTNSGGTNSGGTNSGGRILQINKDTPFSFTGGVQKMRHRHSSRDGSGGYDRR
jgi:hypothetical protein